MIQQHMMESHENQPRKIVVNTKIINRLEANGKAIVQSEFVEYVNSDGIPGPYTSNSSHEGSKDGDKDKESPESPPAEPRPSLARNAPTDTPDEPEPEPEIHTYKCSKCSYSACTTGSVNKHENIHGVEQDTTQRFLCPSCPHSFDNYHRLINHVQFHAGTSIVRFYHCSHCGFCTNVMSRIEDHLLGKHSDLPFKFEVSQEKVLFQEKMANCPDCRYPFLWPKDFMRHIPTHSRCKPYIATLRTRLQTQGYGDAATARDIIREIFAGYRSSQKKAPGQGRKRSADGSIISHSEPTSVDEDPDSMSVQSEESENSGGNNMAIDKYHCDFCEFGTNHFTILQSHMNTKHPEHAAKFKEPTVAVTPRPKATASKPQRTTPVPLSRASPVSTPESDKASPGPEIRNTYLKGSFKCPHCPYNAKNMKYMWRHQQLHKKVVQEGWKCPYCEYRTEIKKSGTFHLRRYHADMPEKLLPIRSGVTAEEAGTAEGETQRDYAQMRSWAQEYSSPYSTTQSRTTVSI